jgi:hypothetical protein
MAVDGRAGDPGLLTDLVDADAVETSGRKELGGGLEDLAVACHAIILTLGSPARNKF